MSTAHNDPGIEIAFEIEELRRRLELAEEMHRAMAAAVGPG